MKLNKDNCNCPDDQSFDKDKSIDLTLINFCKEPIEKLEKTLSKIKKV